MMSRKTFLDYEDIVVSSEGVAGKKHAYPIQHIGAVSLGRNREPWVYLGICLLFTPFGWVGLPWVVADLRRRPWNVHIEYVGTRKLVYQGRPDDARDVADAIARAMQYVDDGG
jgi:hypothetical protein